MTSNDRAENPDRRPRLVVAAHLRAACELHVDRVSGKTVTPSAIEGLGPLAWLVANRPPKHDRDDWRVDGDLRLHMFLDWVFEPRHVVGAPEPLRRTCRVARRRFGIDVYPMTWSQLAIEESVGGNTLVTDRNRYLSSPRLLDAAEAWIRAHTPPDLVRQSVIPPAGEWPWWPTARRSVLADEWPPQDVRLELLQTLSKQKGLRLVPQPAVDQQRLRNQLWADANTGDRTGLVAARQGDVSLRKAWLLLRQMAVEQALAYLSASANSSAPSSRAAITHNMVHRYIAKPWTMEGVLSAGIPVDRWESNREGQVSWQQSAPAILNRMFWSLVSGPDFKRFRARAVVDADLATPNGVKRLELPTRLSSLIAAPGAHIPIAPLSSPTRAPDLMELLSECDDVARKARQYSTIRQVYISAWIGLAKQVREHKHYDATAELELAVQLQGLIWDSADAYDLPGMADLFHALLPLRQSPRAVRDRGKAEDESVLTLIEELGADIGRAEAIAYRKSSRPDWRRSRDAGLRAVDRWQDPRKLKALRPPAWDLIQQDYLALAGFYVSYLEEMLASRKPLDQPVQLLRAASQAVRWSTAAANILESLGPDLPTKRWAGEQKRLALRSWELNTRMIEMRALTAVLICLQTGLLKRRPWAAVATGDSRASPTGKPQTPPHERELRGVLVDRYLSTVDHPELGQRDLGRLLTQAFALLMVNDGQLPVPAEIHPDDMGRRVHFAEVLMNRSGPGTAFEPREPEEVLEEIHKIGFRIGWLERLDEAGPVRLHIARNHPRIGYALAEWQRTHGEGRR